MEIVKMQYTVVELPREKVSEFTNRVGADMSQPLNGRLILENRLRFDDEHFPRYFI